MMEAKYRISETDYANAAKLFGKLTPKILVIYAFFAAVLILFAVFGSSVFQAGAIGGLIGGLIVTVLGRFIISPILVKRHYQKYKAIHDEFTIQLNDECIRFISSTGEGVLIWNNILKWRENKDYILIYPMPRLYHIVPKSIATDGFEVQKLTESLTEHVGEAI